MQRQSRRVNKGRSLAAFLVFIIGTSLAPGFTAAQDATTQATAPPAGTVQIPTGGPLIRVGIGRAVPVATVTAEGGGQVLGPAGEPLAQLAPGAQVQVEAAGAGGLRLAVAGLPPVELPAGPVRLVPAAPTAGSEPPEGLLAYKGRRYRGEIEVRRSPGGGLTVINELPLEVYLRGVVPKEMPPLWPQAALQAQAVASRTYALRTQASGKYAAEGFDVTDDTSSQVYYGAGAEHPNADAAIAATAGQVVTYQGELITTFFHSQSGGHTEDNEVVFTTGSPVPYLRGVQDFDTAAPYYRWEITQTPDELTDLLAAFPLTAGVGKVLRVEPTGIQGSGGRWSHWRIVGSRGEVTITGQQLRTILNLRSSPREVVVSRGGLSHGLEYRPTQTVTVLGAGGSRRTLRVADAMAVGAAAVPNGGTAGTNGTGGTNGSNGAAAHSGSSGAEGQPRPVPARGMVVYSLTPIPVPEAVVVRGGGWGHGVGLSQWGARGLAEQGKTYTEILRHFYSGTQVEPYQP